MVDFEALYDRARFRAAVDLQRESLKERFRADCTFGYAGGLFLIDEALIVTVKAFTDTKYNSIIVPDINLTPIKIDDPKAFLVLILDRHQTAAASYYDKMEELRLARTPEEVVSRTKTD